MGINLRRQFRRQSNGLRQNGKDTTLCEAGHEYPQNDIRHMTGHVRQGNGANVSPTCARKTGKPRLPVQPPAAQDAAQRKQQDGNCGARMDSQNYSNASAPHDTAPSGAMNGLGEATLSPPSNIPPSTISRHTRAGACDRRATTDRPPRRGLSALASGNNKNVNKNAYRFLPPGGNTCRRNKG